MRPSVGSRGSPVRSSARVGGRVRPDAPTGEPRVTYSLTGTTTPTPTEATYTYRVVAHTADVGKVAATLTLTNENGRWLVTALHEVEGPPAS